MNKREKPIELIKKIRKILCRYKSFGTLCQSVYIMRFIISRFTEDTVYKQEIARLEKDATNDEMHRKTQRQHIERLEKELARIKGISVDFVSFLNSVQWEDGMSYECKYSAIIDKIELAKQIHNLIQGGGK